MKTSELIDQAITHIEQGWTQHAYIDSKGMCVLGAINRAANLIEYHDNLANPVVNKAIIRTAEIIREIHPKYRRHDNPRLLVTSFNDADHRTQAEVVAVMEKARARSAEIGD